MPIGEFLPQPKPSFKRNKPTAKKRGEVSPTVREQLQDRSGGSCERCGRFGNLQAAHITRRWQLKETTLESLLHLCISCHHFADNTAEGRKWLSEISKNGLHRNNVSLREGI